MADELAVVAFQFIGGPAVADIDPEVAAPVLAPVGLVKPLHHEREFLDVLRNSPQPKVVLRRVFALVGREEFDDGAQRALRRQKRPVVSFGRTLKPARVVVVDQGGDAVEVGFHVGDENGAIEDGVGNGLGDLGLAAAGDGAGLMA